MVAKGLHSEASVASAARQRYRRQAACTHQTGGEVHAKVRCRRNVATPRLKDLYTLSTAHVRAAHLSACSARRRDSSPQRWSRCVAASGSALAHRRASCWMQEAVVSSSISSGCCKGGPMQWTPSSSGSAVSHAARCMQPMPVINMTLRHTVHGILLASVQLQLGACCKAGSSECLGTLFATKLPIVQASCCRAASQTALPTTTSPTSCGPFPATSS